MATETMEEEEEEEQDFQQTWSGSQTTVLQLLSRDREDSLRWIKVE